MQQSELIHTKTNAKLYFGLTFNSVVCLVRYARICMCLVMKHEVSWSWDVGTGIFFLLCVFFFVCVCMCLSSLCADPNRTLCLALLSMGSGCQSGSRPVQVCST